MSVDINRMNKHLAEALYFPYHDFDRYCVITGWTNTAFLSMWWWPPPPLQKTQVWVCVWLFERTVTGHICSLKAWYRYRTFIHISLVCKTFTQSLFYTLYLCVEKLACTFQEVHGWCLVKTCLVVNAFYQKHLTFKKFTVKCIFCPLYICIVRGKFLVTHQVFVKE